ncbi:gliding motility-associated C-terminal domain-containing protein [Olleya sp. AH-315-K02]|nr:gliding motility-associated C-terminal domain-containing protein [Olleya sp. AH-315-K02]
MKTAINHNKIFKSAFLFAFLLCGFFVKAQVQEAFTPRFNENVKGDITIIANNMLSRTATTNYNGNDGNHDFTNNVYVDIDADNTTFNSSSANFTNPEPAMECLAIKKVFLYWAAADKEQDNGDDNQPSWNYNDVKLMLPGQSSYTTITADDVIFRGRDTHFSNDPYICVKDITSDVIGLSTPYGKYQIANVEAKTGSLYAHPSGNTGTSGGWQIVFVYESPILPTKNITLFDGYAHVTKHVNDFDINFSGFQTVPTGNVNVNVVIGSLEGDQDLSGDRLQIRNTSNNFVDISAPQRSSNNFFNSRITVGNSDFIDRNPASTNTLGFDAAVFTLDNSGNSIITNNQTSATIRLTSNQETYGLYLIGFAVDVWEPDFSPIHLQVNSSNTTENPGGIVPFSFNLLNHGNDDAVNLEIKATIPPQVTLSEPIISLPSGITYTYNNITNELTFIAQDGLFNVGSPELDIDFNLQIKDEFYFLEDNCDLDFELQFIATYNGVQNTNLKSTYSSANIFACNIGDELPVFIDILQPTVDWATATNALDRVIECDDVQGLADALALFPETNKCDFILTKTTGYFVANSGCPTTGTYTNTWSFTDACGVTIADYVQTITVIDTTAPTIDVEASDLTVECDGSGNTDELQDWLDTHAGSNAIDNCSNVTWTNNFTALSDECGATGSATVTFTATDDCGNSSSTIATFTIEDTINPMFVETLPADATVECDNVPDADTLTATDNCCAVDVTFDEVNNAGDCPSEYELVRTWTATDACGLTTIHTQTITVIDTTDPMFVEALPADATVECDNVPDAEILTATDNCGTATVTFDEVNNAGNCPGEYELVRTWTATDACGLTTIHTQTITVIDTTDPTFVEALPADATVECDNVPTAETLTATDNCSTATVTFGEVNNAGACSGEYELVRTWTATDQCGNETIHTQTITVVDTTAPTFTVPQDITIECDIDPNDLTITGDVTDEADNCSVDLDATFSDSAADGNCANESVITRTWTLVDECGNTTTTVQTITVVDTTAPITTTEFDEEINAICGDIPDAPELEFEDACSNNINVSFEETSSFEGSAEDYEIIRTWTVSDECDNETIYTQTVFVTIDSGTIGNSIDLCVGDDFNFNLFDLLSGDFETDGIWEVTSSNATIDGSLFNPYDLELGTYTFTYSDNNSECPGETEVSIALNDDCIVLACGDADEVIISKAVTANGDQWNEYFTITGIELCGFTVELQIFNRWGAKIYESNDYQNNWNGFAHSSSIGKSDKVPTGTYYYIINLKDSGLKPFAGPIYVGTK